MAVNGNTSGISHSTMARLEALAEYKIVDPSHIADTCLLAEMARISAAYQREIAVYLSRNGRVLQIEIGQRNYVSLPSLTCRRHKEGLSGVRMIHTHPNGSGLLSDLDLSALACMHLDCIVAIGIDKDGKCHNAGIAWGGSPSETNELPSHVLISIEALLAVDFSEAIKDLAQNHHFVQDMITEPAEKNKTILVALSLGQSETLLQYSSKELAELAKTAGQTVLQTVIQKRQAPESSTFIGRGKAEELSFLAQTLGANSFIFDHELSAMQIRNLEKITGRAIIDRSMLILDIFASRARSNEGKMQVELAQLQYMLPRLVGQGEVLSRLGGGIGTRGPGETKLEMDRRVIRKRIQVLQERLQQAVKTRHLQRESRADLNLLQIALVGYTNAGKSTLLNTLTGSDVLVEDKLFATLDATIRRMQLPDGRTALFSDTVGFIRKLPHHLVAAFRATLEEVVNADLLLHVIDGSSPEIDEQSAAVAGVLHDLGVAQKPMLTIINKIDKIENQDYLNRLIDRYDGAIAVSALNGTGITNLLGQIMLRLPPKEQEIQIILPYHETVWHARLHKEGKVLAEEYRAEGVFCRALVPEGLYALLQKNRLL